MILLVEKLPIDIMLDLGNWPDLSYSHEFSPQTDSNQHCLFGIYDSKLEQFEVDHGSDKSNDNIDLDGTDDAHNFNNFQNVEFFFFDNYPQIYSSTIGYYPPPWEYYPKSPHPTWLHHRKVIYSIKVFSIKTKICITTIQSINMSKLIPRCTPYELGYYWNVWGFEIVISPPLIQFVLNLSQYHNLY